MGGEFVKKLFQISATFLRKAAWGAIFLDIGRENAIAHRVTRSR